jgi:phage terminase large subunit GpA-like protein
VTDPAPPSFPRALPIVAAIFAGVFAPPEQIAPSAWANQHFVLPDGERKGQTIDLVRTPHLIEPLDAMGPDAPDNELAVMKSAQTAFTTALQISVCHSIDRDPCDMMVVQPTDSALTDFNSQKLGRVLDLSPVMRRKVKPQVARAGKASTTYEKKFSPDCSLFLSLSTSTADLRSKTIKKAWCDEIDEYPADLNDQGDPLDMIEARQTSFLRTGTWKRIYISTPTLKGASSIERKFLAGDQRRWTMVCPHCQDPNLRFEWGERFQFERQYPYKAAYVPPCCGVLIEGWQKFAVYETGRWVATEPGAGKFKSYHFDALSSPFVPWDAIAKKFCDAGNDDVKLKSFWNLTLGLPYELKADVPDHEALMLRREPDLKRGHVPPQGLLLTGFVDVQMRGCWVEIVAHAPNREQWVVDAFYLDGDTSRHTNDVFEGIRTQALDREFPDAFGRMRKVDALGIDSGYRAHVVYAFTRLNQRIHPLSGRDIILATKGMKGWGRPAIGQPSLVDVDMDGRKIKEGCKVWGIGTWSLKASHYSALRLERPADAVSYPDGYRHHGLWLDEVYFRQTTGEKLEDVKVQGQVASRRWVTIGPNHFLDCAVGNMALAEYLGITSTTPEQWARLAVARGLPPEMSELSLFTPRPSSQHDAKDAEAAIERRKAQETNGQRTSPENRLSERTEGWWSRIRR